MIVFRALREEELEKWFVHCMQVFSEKEYDEYFNSYFRRHYYNDPWKEVKGIFVAMDDEVIASTVRVFHREMYINNQLIKIGGIGEVSTKSKYQGRGYSTKLLNMAIDYMRSNEIKISILFTGKSKLGFYNRLGYQSIKRRFKEVDINILDYEEINEKLINPVDDISDIIPIYNHYQMKFNGTINRNEDYYENWFKSEYKNLYIITDKDNKIKSYIDLEISDKLKVREFGTLSESAKINQILASVLKKLNIKNMVAIYPELIDKNSKADNLLTTDGNMIQLISSFELNGVIINSTETLLEHLTDFVYWTNDMF